MTDRELSDFADSLLHLAKRAAQRMQVMLIEKRIARLEKQAGIRKSIVGQDDVGSYGSDPWPSIQLQL